MEKQKKQRLDVLLVEKGTGAREKQKASQGGGNWVRGDGNKEDKAGTPF